VKSKAGALLHT